METCAGCNATAPQHPVIGISAGEDGRTHAHTVCHACWADPAHRHVKLKMAFRERDPRGTGVADAPAQAARASAPAAPRPRGLVAGTEEQFAATILEAMKVMVAPLWKRLRVIEKGMANDTDRR